MFVARRATICVIKSKVMSLQIATEEEMKNQITMKACSLR